MVNVCDQEDPIAITKNYEVTTGNHVALQGEYDGKCRPNIYGNTLVNLNTGTTYDSTEGRIDYILTYAPRNNTLYTIIIDISCVNTSTEAKCWCGFLTSTRTDWVLPPANIKNGLNMIKITVKGEDISKYFRVGWNIDYVSNVVVNKLLILEGDYTNKPIPDYFTGIKSSFEDKLVPENLYKFSSRDDFYSLDGGTTLDGEYITMTANGNYQNAMLKPLGAIKPSTIYTVVVDIVENTLNSNLIIMATKDTITQLSSAQTNLVDTGKTGIFTYAVTTSNDLSGCTRCLANFLNNTNTTGSIKYRIMVVEGDYTNYDFTNYDSTKGGKYKIDYKITGKNKFDKSKTLNGYEITDVGNGTIGANLNWFVTDFIPVIPNTSYKISGKANGNAVLGYNENKQFIANFPNAGTVGITIPNNVRYIKLNGMLKQKDTFQIEEGDTATTYEPYKEFTKTLYLNSPLLEGDTIEDINGKATHVHRYGKVVLDGSNDEKWIDNAGEGDTINGHSIYTRVNIYSNGECMCDKLPVYNSSKEVENLTDFVVLYNNELVVVNVKGATTIKEVKSWLQSNPITLISKLKTPTYETISNDSILCDSYVNGHLDVDSVIPIDKVVFESYGTSLKYLSPNTEYTIQFESDSNGKLDALALNSSDVIGNLNIVKGINKFNITTSDEITINYLWTTGIGFNMSKIVVTPKVEQPFGYFKGMKSVGQDDENGHKIEILSSNSDNTLSNKKEILMNEPLRGLPNGVRDKYVMIDGKWYIEKNTKQSNMSELDFAGDTNDTVKVLLFNNAKPIAISNIFSNHYDYNSITKGQMYIQERDGGLTYAWIPTDSMSNKEFKRFLNEKNAIIIYQLATPTYEPIDYNPFEVYSDITHISNNSIIPCNMVIKNSGYNCILKPNTKYTVVTNTQNSISAKIDSTKVDSTNNVFTIITPSTLTDSVLRFSGKGLTTRNIMLLEGDKTNYIPGYFTGMESAFEQELVTDEQDKNYGKYKVNVKVTDGNKENNITFYINEPLRAVGDIKDKVYVKEDKIIVQRNCGSVTFDGSDTWNLNKIENNIYTYSIRSTKFLTKMKVGTWETLMNNKCYIIDKCGTATTSTPKNEQLLIHNTVEDKFIWYSTPLFSTVQSVKQYLNDNPFKILYQLETPVYEEIEYSNNRLTLDSYNNSTLFYDSNIPVSNTSFKPLWEELVYVKNSTTYYIQFNAIGNGDVVVNLGGTELSTTIIEGYNKIEITTPNESTNLLTIDGQGIKISKVVVSEALCSGYYKGLQSCFEEHMENGKHVCVVRGISLDGSKINGIKFYLNEPLRGIGDIKDKLCIKDNKLMVERNCGSITFDGSDDEKWSDKGFRGHATRNTFEVTLENTNGYQRLTPAISNLFSNEVVEGLPINDNAFRVVTEISNNAYFLFTPSTNIIPYRDTAKWKEFLQQNPITVVYQLATPVYEEVTNEYGLPIILEGYENGIVYVDSAVTPTTSIKYTSNNTVPTTLSNVDNLNTTTQDDINNNIVTYMMDIDMMLTEMEMEDNASTMSLSDSDDNNQKHNTSHNNILDRMNKEDRIKYQDNITKMLEKVIKGKSLTNEENINRIDLYLSEGKIREEQSNYLKELLKEGE